MKQIATDESLQMKQIATDEAEKHDLQAVFLLNTEQRRRPIRLKSASVYFYVTDVTRLDVVL